MKARQARFRLGFHMIPGNRRSQGATMTLGVGASEGGPDNRHRGSDQWLFVVAGRGVAIVAGHRHKLRPGAVVLIERGQTHEIRNTGRRPLQTLNFYVPPAYDAQGEPLPRGKS